MNNSLQNVIRELENLFDLFNNKYFENQLSKPVITVSPDSTKGAYGWCTNWKPWKNGESEYCEINICAEHIAREFEDIAGTMLHEMVHLFNYENGVKDNSRGGTYHNKRFKTSAEAHGLLVEEVEKYGFAKTILNDESKKAIENFEGKSVFTLYREKAGKKAAKKSSRSIKYVCPCCGAIVRATKQVNIYCGDCEEVMIPEI